MDLMFQWALEQMVAVVEPERALVLLCSSSGQLEVKAAHGLDPEAVFTTEPLSLSLLERVRAGAAPLLAADLREDPLFGDISSLLLSDIRSLVCVPFLNPAGEVQGLLYADRRARLAAFTPTDELQLVNLARQLERRLHPGAPPARRPAKKPPEPPAGLGLRSRPQVLLLRSLATLVKAGVTLTSSLALLAESGEDEAMAEVCRRAEASIREGQTLSVSLGRACASLSAFHVRMLEVAERTGSLVEVLEQLAGYEERRHQQAMRLRAALTYPLFLFVACLVMLVAVPPLVLQGQFQALAAAGVEPPALTRAMMAISDFTRGPFALPLLALLVGVGIFLARHLARDATARLWLLRTPVLGPCLRTLTTARFAQTLALEMQVGLPILEGLRLAVEVTDDPVLLGRLPAAIRALEDGCDLAGSLHECDYFPAKFLMALASGEEAGKLPPTLSWLARLYQEELEATVEMAAASLEPAMMLFMGVVGGLVAVATLLPLVGLVQNL